MATTVDYSGLTSAIDVGSVSGQLVSVAGTLIVVSITMLVIKKIYSLVRRG